MVALVACVSAHGPAACFVHTALHRISLSQAVARLGVEVCVGDGLWLVNAQQLLMFVANKPHSQAVVRCNVAFCRRHPVFCACFMPFARLL